MDKYPVFSVCNSFERLYSATITYLIHPLKSWDVFPNFISHVYRYLCYAEKGVGGKCIGFTLSESLQLLPIRSTNI